MNIVELKNVSKVYQSGEHEVKALKDVNLEIEQGKFVVILGPSGAGKSTLLNLLGGLDSPSSGTIIVDSKDIAAYSADELAEYRADKVGFVFQFYNLVPTLTVYENVALIKEIAPDALDAKELLDKVGLADHYNKFPVQLSGGEQQRVSIARALAKNPEVILCDEPTGALDYKTGKQILELLEKTCRKDKITTIIITHNNAIAPMADRVIKFKNGIAEEVIINKNPISVKEIEW